MSCWCLTEISAHLSEAIKVREKYLDLVIAILTPSHSAGNLSTAHQRLPTWPKGRHHRQMARMHTKYTRILILLFSVSLALQLLQVIFTTILISQNTTYSHSSRFHIILRVEAHILYCSVAGGNSKKCTIII